MLLKQLTSDAERWLHDHDYTESTIYHNYVRFWNKFCKEEGGDANYSYSLLTAFAASTLSIDMEKASPSALSLKDYRAYHALKSLDSFASAGTIPGTSMKGAAVRQPLTSASQEAMGLYMDHLTALGYSDATMRYAKQTVHDFLYACPIECATGDGVASFLCSMGGHAKQTVSSISKTTKRFLVFAHDAGITKSDLSQAILSQKKRQGTEIPSVYTPEEVARLIDYLATHADNRKRNRAIATIIAAFGFRAKDVAGLLLSDVDWDEGTIRVTQSKTGIPIEHRISGAVGNGLADYLLNERPGSSDPHVFLKADGHAMKATSISTMISSGFVNSGIPIHGRKHASHSLRHSLATNMLADGEDILTISKTIGHGSVESTRIYTKVDVRHLRLCELEVPAHA